MTRAAFSAHSWLMHERRPALHLVHQSVLPPGRSLQDGRGSCRGRSLPEGFAQETSRPPDHISDVGLGKFLNGSDSKCGDMQPSLRREVQAGETSQPLLCDRCQLSRLWRASEQYVPVQHALPRPRFGPALPAVDQLAWQPCQAFPLGVPGKAPELNALICSLICAALGSRRKRCRRMIVLRGLPGRS
jgi:hypothetical protein